MNIENIQQRLAKFADERNWNKYHTPKNLSMALAGEVGELTEVFQWLTEDESLALSKKQLDEVREEVADIAIYLIRICAILNIDLNKAVEDKIALNEKKYPVNLAKGNAIKYNRRN